MFRPEKPVATKLQFIFNLFDYNMDDTLDPEELAEMITIVSAPAKVVSGDRCAMHLDTVPKHILVVGLRRQTAAGQSQRAPRSEDVSLVSSNVCVLMHTVSSRLDQTWKSQSERVLSSKRSFGPPSLKPQPSLARCPSRPALRFSLGFRV